MSMKTSRRHIRAKTRRKKACANCRQTNDEGTIGPQTSDTSLELKDLLEEVYPAHPKWYNVGLQLGVPSYVLVGFRQTYHSPQDCLREALKWWVSNHTPTWRALIDALKSRSVSEIRLATELEMKYFGRSESPATFEGTSNEHYSQARLDISSLPTNPLLAILLARLGSQLLKPLRNMARSMAQLPAILVGYWPRRPPQYPVLQLEDAVDQLMRMFEVTPREMSKIAALLTEDFRLGLRSKPRSHSVKMLPTYINLIPRTTHTGPSHSRKKKCNLGCTLPGGSGEGDILVLKVGGKTFKLNLYTINGGKPIIRKWKEVEIDQQTKQSTQKELFDLFAQGVAEFLKEHKVSGKIPLALVFPFPVRQVSLKCGVLMNWTKGYAVKGAVGKDVVKLLGDAFTRRGDVHVDIVALLNDTTVTQLDICHKDPYCYIGLVLSTGMNASYTEKVDAVRDYSGSCTPYSHTIINTEVCAFGDDGQDLPRNGIDEEVDEASTNRGLQKFEKMVSAKYLGEIVQTILRELIRKGLFQGRCPPRLSEPGSFDPKYISLVEDSDNDDCKKLLKEAFHVDASDIDCEVVRKVCEAISTRAARLAATVVVAIARKIDRVEKCTVAVDGMLYKNHSRFRARMQDAIDELAGPDNGIRIKETENGGGRSSGAAIVAFRFRTLY